MMTETKIRVIPMPIIKPVSDLRNYGEILRDVAVGQPVFLTKNGHGRYAVLDMEDYREYEHLKAVAQALPRPEPDRAAEADGWLPAEDAAAAPELPKPKKHKKKHKKHK